MRARAEAWLNEVWYGDRPMRWLRPLGVLTAAVALLRRRLFRSGLLLQRRLPVPVVVVGNITVGGTGKTPLVLWLCAWLARAGLRPGISCRGYGGTARAWPIDVCAASAPELVGDEAVLLASRGNCPVVAGPDRYAAGLALLRHGVDVIVCDDGLQHYRLARDLEILVVDGERGLGNRRCLPAGPLREPARRSDTVDLIIVNAPATAVPAGALSMALVPMGFASVRTGDDRLPEDAFRGRQAHAVAAIGHPERFFRQLEALGVTCLPRALPDHAALGRRDIGFDDDLAVLMTEKDAVKCRDIAGPEHWYLEVEARLPEHAEAMLTARLARLWPAGNKETPSPMDKKLLDILACPICKSPLQYRKEAAELVCRGDRLAFPIRDGIPVMLEDEARKLSSEELEA